MSTLARGVAAAALTDRERSELAELEAVVGEGLDAFLRVGSALAEIRDRRLYRETHDRFEDYLQERWRLGKSRGHQLINAFRMHEVVSTVVDTTRMNERMWRPLLKLRDPEKVIGVLSTTVERYGRDSITSGLLERLVDDHFARRAKGRRVTEDVIPPLPRVPRSRPGTFLDIGEHRVLAGGDALQPNDVLRVMDGVLADAACLDFPYGVGVEGRTAATLSLPNDDPEWIKANVGPLFATAAQAMKPGASLYAFTPDGQLGTIFAAAFEQHFHHHQGAYWVKDRFVAGHCDHQPQAERMLYGWKPGGKADRRGGRAHRWYGGRSASSNFPVPRPARNPDHPTAKPVELIRQMLVNICRPGEVVLDLTLGSGSTLLAADVIGALCFGLEIDPGYSDVIEERYATREWKQTTEGKGP